MGLALTISILSQQVSSFTLYALVWGGLAITSLAHWNPFVWTPMPSDWRPVSDLWPVSPLSVFSLLTFYFSLHLPPLTPSFLLPHHTQLIGATLSLLLYDPSFTWPCPFHGVFSFSLYLVVWLYDSNLCFKAQRQSSALWNVSGFLLLTIILFIDLNDNSYHMPSPCHQLSPWSLKAWTMTYSSYNFSAKYEVSGLSWVLSAE